MKTTKLILLSILAVLIVSIPAFSQRKLEVDADINTPSLTLTPFDTAGAPLVPDINNQNEAKIYYNSEDKEVKIAEYPDSWGSFATAKNIATIIVAASDSLTPDKAGANYQCDGTDDQQEINKAINAIVAAGIGGSVYLLEGTYNISDVLLDGMTIKGIVMKSTISLFGAGKGTILKLVSGITDTNVIHAASVSRILITQLMVDGNTRTGNNNNGIYFAGVTDSKVFGNWVEQMEGYQIALYNSSSHNAIYNNHLLGGGGTDSGGIIVSNSSNNNFISNNDVRNCGSDGGIVLSVSPLNNIISGNNLQGNYSGIYLNTGSKNIIVSNNIQDSYSGPGFSADSITNCTISGNNIENNTDGMLLTGSTQGCVIYANNVHLNTDNGIKLDGSTAECVVVSNTVYENGQDGILLTADSAKILISSNRIYDSSVISGYYGINIESSNAGRGNHYLVGNHISGAGFDAEINDLGDKTKYTDKAKITLERRAVLSLGAGANIDPATSPRTYIPVISSAAGEVTVTISDGQTAGNLLILEGTNDTKKVTINDSGNVNLGGNRTLQQYDLLELIWNGTSWVEISYTNYDDL